MGGGGGGGGGVLIIDIRSKGGVRTPALHPTPLKDIETKKEGMKHIKNAGPPALQRPTSLL